MAASAASSFRVSWSRFPSHVLSALDNLRLDEDFVDVSIYCGHRLIKAHRNVLSASSNYFKEIFKSNPSSHPVVILCDVDHASLRSLVDFMYHGEIEVPTARLDELLRLGEMLQVQGISSYKGVSGTEDTAVPPEPEPEPALPAPPGEAAAPECVLAEPGRRRYRSGRRRTASAGREQPPTPADPQPPPPPPTRVKAEWPEEPPPPPDAAAAAGCQPPLDDTDQSGLDLAQHAGGIFVGGLGSRRPLTGAERARRYRERKKLKKLYETLLGGSPRREQLAVQL